MQLASTILMIRPKHFGFNTQTEADNAFQSSVETKEEESTTKAIDEFDKMAAQLKANEIDVIVMDDTDFPAKPDAVFCNNWLCTLPSGELFTFPMKAVNRQCEVRADIIDFLKNNYQVKNYTDLSHKAKENIFLESTGSIVFDHDNKIAYACLSQRTNKNLLEEFCEEIGYKAFSFSASLNDGKEIYHTNVMMNVGETYAVVCLDAIKVDEEKNALIKSFKETAHEIIPISYEQMHAFAGNMIQVKTIDNKKITVLSRTAFDAFDKKQLSAIERHTKLLPISIPFIETIGGGSVRCMITEIFLAKK